MNSKRLKTVGEWAFNAAAWIVAIPVFAVMAVVMAIGIAKLLIVLAVLAAVVIAVCVITAPFWGIALLYDWACRRWPALDIDAWMDRRFPERVRLDEERRAEHDPDLQPAAGA